VVERQPPSPVVVISIDNVRTLQDVRKWSEIVEHVGLPPSSPVAISVTGEIKVTAWLAQVPWPPDFFDLDEDDQPITSPVSSTDGGNQQ
jgi:hypothetical protein